MNDLVERAAGLAAFHLDTADLANRWAHVQGVAAQAFRLRAAVPDDDQDLLIAAAWLHDIGYAPALVKTGMHAIDGAIFLDQEGFLPRLVALVAHHTGARFEAAERGLIRELDAFDREEGPVPDALTTADLTVGPTGQPLDVSARIEEILVRYPHGTAVHRAISRARSSLIVQTEQTHMRLGHHAE
ncbi:HD domain-containing protein [Catelliglobosispora koreensis]|uniref:HD domain-containing protein n=1 Tax=Catelliglobosispora koreensis TaxID=129052 RepID=UPI00036C1FEA|nr:HD domain-containing protein [Catelliglobosispora koreensis]